MLGSLWEPDSYAFSLFLGGFLLTGVPGGNFTSYLTLGNPEGLAMAPCWEASCEGVNGWMIS